MSRLDSVIRRLEAQRACLDLATRLVADLPGPVFELGLGNGRTYDHLRERLPGREIFVLEREVTAHPDCVPDAAHLILGDFRDTLPDIARRFAGCAALVHADTGTGDEAASRALARGIAPQVDALLAPGGILASDQPMESQRWTALPLPRGVAGGRYFLFRAGP